MNYTAAVKADKELLFGASGNSCFSLALAKSF